MYNIGDAATVCLGLGLPRRLRAPREAREAPAPHHPAAAVWAGPPGRPAAGTARAACYALQQMGIGTFYVYNRSTDKAKDLAEKTELIKSEAQELYQGHYEDPEKLHAKLLEVQHGLQAAHGPLGQGPREPQGWALGPGPRVPDPVRSENERFRREWRRSMFENSG